MRGCGSANEQKERERKENDGKESTHAGRTRGEVKQDHKNVSTIVLFLAINVMIRGLRWSCFITPVFKYISLCLIVIIRPTLLPF